MTATTAATRPSIRATRSGVRALLLLFKARAVVVLVALLILFSSLAPAFSTANNFQILTKHVAIAAILAIGMTFVVLTGGIDLSVGSVAGLAGMLVGYLLTQGIEVGGSRHFLPVTLCVLMATLHLAPCGTLEWLACLQGRRCSLHRHSGDALCSARHRVADFEWQNLPESWGGRPLTGTRGFPLGQTFFFGMPMPVWIMLVLFAAALVIARKTPLGRHIYAVGGNERAARLAGIRVPLVKLFTYVFSLRFVQP